MEVTGWGTGYLQRPGEQRSGRREGSLGWIQTLSVTLVRWPWELWEQQMFPVTLKAGRLDWVRVEGQRGQPPSPLYVTRAPPPLPYAALCRSSCEL